MITTNGKSMLTDSDLGLMTMTGLRSFTSSLPYSSTLLNCTESFSCPTS